MREKTY